MTEVEVEVANILIDLSKSSSSPFQSLMQVIADQTKKESTKNIWVDSPFKDLVKLQSNNAGIVGEKFILEICQTTGISVDIDGSKTKKIGGGSGDGIINGKQVEIKTAHLGCDEKSFQHELGEGPWKAEFSIFVDIAPKCIYLTIFKNFSEEIYKNNTKCEPYFPTKSVTWRKKSGAFKLDTTVKINEQNIQNNYTLKITENIDYSTIHDFILLHIQ